MGVWVRERERERAIEKVRDNSHIYVIDEITLADRLAQISTLFEWMHCCQQKVFFYIYATVTRVFVLCYEILLLIHTSRLVFVY